METGTHLTPPAGAGFSSSAAARVTKHRQARKDAAGLAGDAQKTRQVSGTHACMRPQSHHLPVWPWLIDTFSFVVVMGGGGKC